MKINGTPVQNAQEARSSRSDASSRTAGGSESGTARTGAGTAEVQISAGGQLRQAALQILDATPDIDSAKVDRLKTAIENGSYHVDPDKVASAFLQVESELFD